MTHTTWFPEPRKPHPSWARHDESLLDWLSRSTVARAYAAREFLNYNISLVPMEWQEKLFQDLRSLVSGYKSHSFSCLTLTLPDFDKVSLVNS